MTNQIKMYKELSSTIDNVQKELEKVSNLLNENLFEQNSSIICSFKAILMNARCELNESLNKFDL